jgi:hypothetical protein
MQECEATAAVALAFAGDAVRARTLADDFSQPGSRTTRLFSPMTFQPFAPNWR